LPLDDESASSLVSLAASADADIAEVVQTFFFTRPFLTRSPDRYEISSDMRTPPFYLAVYHRDLSTPFNMYVDVHEDLTATLHWAEDDLNTLPEDWQSSFMSDIPGLLRCFEIRDPVPDRRYFLQRRYFEPEHYLWLRDQLRSPP
jgi:hypothetical protein